MLGAGWVSLRELVFGDAYPWREAVTDYWGIDPSTYRVSLGVSLEDTVQWRTCSLDRADGGARRLAGAHRDLWAFFAAAGRELGAPARIGVEQPFAGPNMVHPESQWMLGVVLAVLGGVFPGVGVVLLPVPKWKLAATGRGIAARDTILAMPCPECGAVAGVACDAKRPHSKRLRKAEKQRLVSWARARGYDGLLSDEADAIGVAVACRVLSGAEALSAAQTSLPVG